MIEKKNRQLEEDAMVWNTVTEEILFAFIYDIYILSRQYVLELELKTNLKQFKPLGSIGVSRGHLALWKRQILICLVIIKTSQTS